MKVLKRIIAIAFLVAVWVMGWHFVGAHNEVVRLDYGMERFYELPFWQALLGVMYTTWHSLHKHIASMLRCFTSTRKLFKSVKSITNIRI